MDLAFILLTWNSGRHIEAAVRSILATLGDGRFRYEIVVADNGSKDRTLAILEGIRKETGAVIRVIRFERNLGTTLPRNRAIRSTNARLIVVMDSDVELLPGTVEVLAGHVESDDSIGMAVPRLVYGSGAHQKSTDRFPTIWNKALRYLFLRRIERREGESEPGRDPRDVDYAISALWVLRREIFDRVGYLDEKIFYAPEDVDFCLRIWKGGFRILYDPRVSAVHHAQEISRGFRLNRSTLRHVAGLAYYFRKHRYLFGRPTI